MNLKVNDLKNYKRIHLIGIGGISMSAIAETLHNWGYTVTGSDITRSEITDKLNEHNIITTIGHDLINSKNADLIVYSAAIKETDPEILIAKEKNIPLVGRGKFVGLLTKMYKETICIAGTHGKTTTTSMVSVCFLNAQKDPTIEVGAILKNINGNYKIGKSEFFILESCEYKGNFLKFFPHAEIILNIDNDHLDYYKTFDNVVKAFQDFSKILPSDGVLITNADDKNCYNLKNITKSKFISYGIENENANFVAKNITYDDNGFAHFDVYKNGNLLCNLNLSVAGKHNVLNALACTALCDYYNIDVDVIKKSLKEFTGAERRLEFKGYITPKNSTTPSVSVFDDYGHHPTEIEATANAISEKKYNESWVIFQPHTYSRTKTHLDSFARVLTKFDHIILLDIYAAREKNTIGITSKDLAQKIKDLGREALYMPKFEDVVTYIKSNVKDKDLVLTLGAGTVTNIGPMLTEK